MPNQWCQFVEFANLSFNSVNFALLCTEALRYAPVERSCLGPKIEISSHAFVSCQSHGVKSIASTPKVSEQVLLEH